MAETVSYEPCPRCSVMVAEHKLEEHPEHCRAKQADERAKMVLYAWDPEGKAGFDNFATTNEPMIRLAVDIGSKIVGGHTNRGLLMLGPPGVGKTHLMVSLAREAMKVGRTLTFVNALALIRTIQSSYTPDAPPEHSRGAIISRIRQLDLLFLDDMGKERASEDARNIVYELIDGMYVDGKTLIGSSNLEPEDFKQHYEPAVRSRLAEMVRTVQVSGPDRRRQGEGSRYR